MNFGRKISRISLDLFEKLETEHFNITTKRERTIKLEKLNSPWKWAIEQEKNQNNQIEREKNKFCEDKT